MQTKKYESTANEQPTEIFPIPIDHCACSSRWIGGFIFGAGADKAPFHEVLPNPLSSGGRSSFIRSAFLAIQPKSGI
ncbi:MAG: hypothetical protein H0X66_17165 [Verrucomicrobia bacterium]|nr:hypothetical protein [Verrucomicrobiota bacterium]